MQHGCPRLLHSSWPSSNRWAAVDITVTSVTCSRRRRLWLTQEGSSLSTATWLTLSWWDITADISLERSCCQCDGWYITEMPKSQRVWGPSQTVSSFPHCKMFSSLRVCSSSSITNSFSDVFHTLLIVWRCELGFQDSRVEFLMFYSTNNQ